MTPGPASAVGTVVPARGIPTSHHDRSDGAFATDAETLFAETHLADRPLLMAVVVLAWMGVGLAGAAIMARRGHDFRPLAGLAVVLGPLFAGFVVANLRPREQGTPALVVRAPVDLGGDLRAAVLITGDAAAAGAARSTLAEHPSLRSVEILRPITYETADGSGEQPARDDAVNDLEIAGNLLAEFQPGLTMLPGKTARSMSEHLEHARPDLVVIVGDTRMEPKLDRHTSQHVRVVSVGNSGSR